LNLLPVGNKRVVNSKETVVVHWRDVIAESLAFSSDSEVNRKALVFDQFGTKREYIEANPLSVSAAVLDCALVILLFEQTIFDAIFCLNFS
jgi:hypothetical protein